MKALLLLTGILAATLMSAGSQTPDTSGIEHGTLPARWNDVNPECKGGPSFSVHDYTPTFVIIRQSGCTNPEKPFLYVIFGSKQALLVDTGAEGADVSRVVDAVLFSHGSSRRTTPLPLLVLHSHGHGDHTAGDAALKGRSDTRVIDATPTALTAFFAGTAWPRGVAELDLGERMLDVLAIPGHEPASIAIYDRRTGILLTGDSLYPGRLYVRDARAFRDSIDRLVEFTATRPVAHVLGAHVENQRTPYLDYPPDTKVAADEHVLELGRSHLLELQDALRQMGEPLQRRAYRDFTIWPITR